MASLVKLLPTHLLPTLFHPGVNFFPIKVSSHIFSTKEILQPTYSLPTYFQPSIICIQRKIFFSTFSNTIMFLEDFWRISEGTLPAFLSFLDRFGWNFGCDPCGPMPFPGTTKGVDRIIPRLTYSVQNGLPVDEFAQSQPRLLKVS